jgi:hypothetical protein
MQPESVHLNQTQAEFQLSSSYHISTLATSGQASEALFLFFSKLSAGQRGRICLFKRPQVPDK